MRTSYSAISTYKSCPLKYKFQEIDKIKTPKSKEAVFGTAVHEALNFMFHRDPLYPTLDEVFNFFRGIWSERSQKIKLPDGESDVYIDDGIKILKNFYSKNQPWNFDVVDLESRFDVLLRDPKTGEEHTLAGVIDRVDKIDDKTFEIIDYKTARKMPSQDVLDRDLQMSIYHLGLIKRWPHLEARDVKLSLYFLQHNEKITTTRSAESLDKTKDSILAALGEIQAKMRSGDFPATPGPLCDWCGYKEICPMWRHLYKKDAPDEREVKIAVDEYLNLKKEVETRNARIKSLQAMIHAYLDDSGLGRVFGDEGFITRAVKSTPEFDIEKLRPILEEAGFWNEVLKVDDRKVAKAVASLSPALRERVLREAFLGENKTKTLTISRKKAVSDE